MGDEVFDLASHFRARGIVRTVASGSSFRQAARLLQVGGSTATHRVTQSRETGDMAPRPRRGSRRLSRIDLHSALIIEWIDAEPDLTLPEIAGKLEDTGGYRAPRNGHSEKPS